MLRFLPVALILLCGWPTLAQADPPQSAKQRLIDKVCNLIQAHADKNGLPRDFFARLIWKESRFDPNAVSPVGAEGIAQFMPGTAKMRGLANSFDINQAIPASAKYLAEMKTSYGNLGLAAAAYNAGENRVSRWLGSGGFLPMETESYVFDIMGEPVDKFADRAYAGSVRPLDAKSDFVAACRKLPVIMSRTVAMASINIKPWGIQVAGNFRRSAAVNQWLRVRGRFPALLAGHDPVVSRVRTPIGRRGIYAVRIGVDDRAAAGAICQKLQSVGGACVVVRNR
ncbi:MULTISPECIES: lytic transglycosylase domain-containing protein [unclassified Mesorhizobium]|uniref:lytic transglycosylase domain-containing protein n=1 Tax=unclassified Mesorhizobium TaxID=325217 RepID=UPI00112E25C2|nr:MULTISPECIES: lytic transglycosylase domain-containing protein [unclassified Mesorhizobium]MBZ9984283.1 lytic transglycosylase domain-containing protein [Mesorhizobium sp. BR-1-1-8]TPL30996.1 lytic transglycosylase domain-containing protein [Mesorhizobium sp. B2-4-8]TPL59550.1 lytic transglycosylase domain-containing protein [Mesorhizobium sp. B2-4-1]